MCPRVGRLLLPTLRSRDVFTPSRKAMSLLIMKVWRRCMICMNVRERRAILPPSPFYMFTLKLQTSFHSTVPFTNCFCFFLLYPLLGSMKDSSLWLCIMWYEFFSSKGYDHKYPGPSRIPPYITVCKLCKHFYAVLKFSLVSFLFQTKSSQIRILRCFLSFATSILQLIIGFRIKIIMKSSE